MEQSDDVAGVARKYLELWVEHWASSLASPEAMTMMTRVMTALADAAGVAKAPVDAASAGRQPGGEPAPLCAAPNAGGRRLDECEERIAALERRLTALEAVGLKNHEQPPLARPAAKPRRRPRAV